MSVLRLIDETPGGHAIRTIVLPLGLVPETLTVSELLARRIEQEVAAFNASAAETFDGLVEPRPRRAGARRELDPVAQLEAACAAFERGGFLMIVGDEQVESLDARVVIRSDLEIRFIKLVALVGG